MSQNLTQPEEIDHAFMEMSGQGMKIDAPDSGIIRYLDKSAQQLRCGESADPKRAIRGKSLLSNP